MKTKIAKAKKELFYRCQGRCDICFIEGDCNLEKDIKKLGLEHIKKLVYNLKEEKQMFKNIIMRKYAVDLPQENTEEWTNVAIFKSKKQAIKFVRAKYGADKYGRVNLISTL